MKRENRGFPHGVDSSRTGLSQKVMLLENSLTEANFGQFLKPLSFFVPLAALDFPCSLPSALWLQRDTGEVTAGASSSEVRVGKGK